MSLRTRLLVLFAALGVVPLCALGAANHVQAMRALEALLERQTRTIAERAAAEIGGRHAVQQSDLLLLAENLETRELLEAYAAGGEALEDARRTAVPFLEQLWRQYAPSYHTIEIRDASGALVHRLGEDAVDPFGAGVGSVPGLSFQQAVPGGLGMVVVRPQRGFLLPEEALETRFGTAGYSVVVERATGRALYQGMDAYGRPVPDPGLPQAVVGATDAVAGGLRLRIRDSVRVASYVALETPAWTIVSVAALDEFAPPFARLRTVNLVVLLLVTVGVSTAFALAIRQAMRSLAALTRAADAVGRGDFAPALPPPGKDEVGRLGVALGLMAGKVAEMIEQVQRSRQMAAIGEFAAEISHEIRNPLTSVKLNLQRIARTVRSGGSLADVGPPLDISMREIDRLERVVSGVLHLGRPHPQARRSCAFRELVAGAVETVRPQAERQGVHVVVALADVPDLVRCDPEQIRAALLNLLLNGVEAMPCRGVLRVETLTRDEVGAAPAVAVRIADSGPGIPEDVRVRLFRPFFTTKAEGTGLGLATALRIVEEHGGALVLEDSEAGASFRLELPLVAERVPS